MAGADADAGDGADAMWSSGTAAGREERIFQATLTELEGVGMPAESAQFCFDGRARAAAVEEAARIRSTRRVI